MACKKKGKGKGKGVAPVKVSLCDQIAAQVEAAGKAMNMRIAAALMEYQNAADAARADYDKAFSAIFGD